MTDGTLKSLDRDAVHVFSVQMPEDAFWAFLTPDPETGEWGLKDALNVEVLDEHMIEGAMTADLDGIGLAGFMTEGVGVDASGLSSTDRTVLDGLDGPVVIVRGAAFDGADVAVRPVPPLAHVGTWHLTPAPTTMEPLRSQAANGNLPPAPPEIAPAPRSRALTWVMLALAALILLGVIVGMML
ncbi:hypothetical protein ACRARG_06860 [Pseudooceanicola sp. C21-150M6]|uniref:hypothetical protein n=1 Tax=Pseudooceanicola sp. C21-150M6 TaxID=3434355 RepID=UPI003D7F5A45